MTNRVQAFNKAFLSRIHIALHFNELSQGFKEQVWAAFFNKVSTGITKEQIHDLSTCNVNGQQIKNTVRTVHLLAVGRGEKLEFGHFVETLDAMNRFTSQFKSVQSRDQ